MAMAIRLAMPRAASPAPWNKKVWSASLVLVACSEANTPAHATLAVPWMSSLKVQYLLRYFSRNRKAFWLPKSSNWMRVFCPYL